MNYKEMTPAERRAEKVKGFILAAFIGCSLAWLLADALSK